MARLSKEERAELERQLAEDDAAEDDYEVEFYVDEPDGRRRGGRMPYSKGKTAFGKLFPDLFGEPEPKEKPKGEGGKDEPAGEVRRFGGRRIS